MSKTASPVKVFRNDEIGLTMPLDASGAAIIIPHCENAEEVEHFKQEAFFCLKILFCLSFR
jgi:hypothetical protein